MNAVICTDGTAVDDLKLALSKVPDMKGLELASKVSSTIPYFYGDENSKYKIAALDIKNIS
jgi:carbamoyl-phosphate synthase small subunit